MWTVLNHVHWRVRVWARFIRARRGNVAITFAFSLIPMLILVGVAIDYSRANSVKAAMQVALDSTALSLSKRVGMLTTDQVQTSAQDYFKALFTRREADNVKVTASYSNAAGSQVVITSSADMATEFLGMIGYKTFHITASTTAKWGASRLRVALVLDTTGSMSSNGKIDALKIASKKLLSQLQSAASIDGDVYVSIIPFAKDVRIEPNHAAPWDDWVYWDNNAKSDPTSWDATHGICSASNSVLTRSNCRGVCSISGNNSETCTAAGVCSISGYSTISSCTAAGTCSISGKSNQSACTAAGACSISGHSTQSSCTSAGVCSKSQFTTQSMCI
jgi:Flp pilus assembly protein TadG